MEIIIMITIDMIDENQSRSEKPYYRTDEYSAYVDHRIYDPVHVVLENQRNRLLQAAHTARILKTSRRNNLAIEVQRWMQKTKGEMITLVERYARRLGYL
jgi:hypothetical protein